MENAVLFAVDDCIVCDMACRDWYGNVMPVLSHLMGTKENSESSYCYFILDTVNMFLRLHDQHCMLMHGKYIRNLVLISRDLVRLPLIAIVDYTEKRQMTKSYGQIMM